jgi:hypothetical protein
MTTNWMNIFAKRSKKNGVLNLIEFKEIIYDFQFFLKLPALQCRILSVYCILCSRKNSVKTEEIIEILEESTNFNEVVYHLEKLIASGWLCYDFDGPFSNSNSIFLSHNAEVALKTSKTSCFPHMKNNETDQVMQIYARALSLRNKNIDVESWHKSVNTWIKSFKLPLLNELKVKNLEQELKSIALYIALVYLIEGQTQELNQLLKIFSGNPIKQLELKKKILNENNPLYLKNLLEKTISPRGDEYLKPSEYWQNKMIQSNNIIDNIDPNLPKSLVRVMHDSIIERKLHYNIEVREQIYTLHKILTPINYKKYTKEINKKRENSGIIILLTGDPGTGKTELVKQLAKATERDLLYFDVSKQRNMYLGESEKAIQEVFSKYSELVKQSTHPPILFFNESDSIFTKRRSIESGVSQTENTVQTILLNELERFNGILICTTNKPESMDQAFERRFLMQIEITIPDKTVRIQLLKENFPELSLGVINELSKEHLFTGANLETYKQQKMIKRITLNKKFDEAEELRCFFKNLRLNTTYRQPIGFK